MSKDIFKREYIVIIKKPNIPKSSVCSLNTKFLYFTNKVKKNG